MSRSYLVTDPTQSLILLLSPDCLTISVESGKNSISIEQIRDLKEWIALKPFKNPQKIAFIPNANKMTTEAQNSLLKILEEPPLNSFIVLSCKNKRQLLPTVVSRCFPLFAPKRLLEISELSRSFTIVDHSDESEKKEKEEENLEHLSLVEGFELAEKIAKLERIECGNKTGDRELFYANPDQGIVALREYSC
ncbi:MAG: polymerase III, delta prime subunit protein [candidate division CPR1 bacterium GW2011_GWA2_42_17]|uniref:Polymerase III, delta prime subunit protein n=1 Tax=candidate division CPR1 bacterium GW2011_GWA2_42_17 TaxID=1618341 RepID=A0A0G0YXZ9_9BACT|nr:MAG: polymerase III, delta prime subunit protein [candidate division CPR1 bacterium GW2011_GWA2_42_17]